MRDRVRYTRNGLLIGMITLGSWLVGSATVVAKTPYEWAFVRLDYARREKVDQLNRFCQAIRAKASEARTDETLAEFFDVSRRHFRLAHDQGLSGPALETSMSRLRKAIDAHYIRNYLCFYDILMIDEEGRIFYTLRKESDFGEHIFDGKPGSMELASALRASGNREVFVDFHYYAASDEPAAFFIQPMTGDGEPQGWMVLQCAINKVNSIFAGAEELGASGETILVNRDGYMLTESNFEGNSTILEKQLDDRNIRAKFDEGVGHRRVTDYRGCTALTSFEVVEFEGASWLVVAKVDEDEIVTEHYRQHRQYYHDRILACLHAQGGEGRSKAVASEGRKVIKVDMDEFVRANHHEVLRTVGVSTCTAVIAAYPGKFGYLAHISPQDRVYGGNVTNLLGHVIKKIKTYDIYKFERPRVRFRIVVRHNDSLSQIVDKLVDEGFLLSQIGVLYGLPGHYANVTYAYREDRVSVEWVPSQPGESAVVQHAQDGLNLGVIVKGFIDESTGAGSPEGASGSSLASHVPRKGQTDETGDENRIGIHSAGRAGDRARGHVGVVDDERDPGVAETRGGIRAGGQGGG